MEAFCWGELRFWGCYCWFGYGGGGGGVSGW